MEKRVVVYITGGIASYKVPGLIRLLVKKQFDVRVAMTEAATKFITPLTLEVLSKNKVITAFDDDHTTNFIPHIDLAKWADYSIIVPATMDIIGKLANGIADDLVSTAVGATPTNKYLIPAMNDEMWSAKANQRNIEQLKQDGYFIMPPAVGPLAEGYTARGRMPEVDEIYQWFNTKINLSSSLLGKQILVTAGGTQEPIDPVRYIGNYSSGKMGIEIAKAAHSMGAEVTLIAGRTNVALPDEIDTIIRIKTFSDLKKHLLQTFPQCDALIMAAAVSDYHVVDPAHEKIKVDRHQELTLRLAKNENLLRILRKQRKNQLMIGFAAETDNLMKNAQQEFANKKIDMIVANDVSRKDIGFGSDNNEVYLITKNNIQKISKTTKSRIAWQIMLQVTNFFKKEED